MSRNFPPKNIPTPENDEEIRQGLPHLFAYGWYGWAREFRECREKIALLCAGNQISKSSTQIRTCIDWATNKRLWKELWPSHHQNVNLFWYLYPSQKVVDAEFKTKWKQFLPRGKFKEHPLYGWKELKDGMHTAGIEFNSGLLLLFKTYSQKEVDLQTATVFALFCFTAGQLVETRRGLVPIEKIVLGDVVKTRTGWDRVTRLLDRQEPVITREFSNGESIEATPGHRFWTKNRGYVAFSDLTETDILISSPAWKIKKKLYCLKEFLTTGTQNLRINGTLNILKVFRGRVKTAFTTSHFTRAFMVKSRAGIQCITSILIRLTTTFQIFVPCPVGNTHNYIKRQNGLPVSTSIVRKSAKFVARILKLEPLKKLQPNVVLNHAESFAMRAIELACTAGRFFGADKIIKPVHVLGSAPVSTEKKKVYNITVENSHNYYLSGVNCANCDEELPMRHYYEFMLRISAVDGYFRMVFTATLGQEFWRKVMEPDLEAGEVEQLPHAWKRQISLYDALEYEDGSPGGWTLERIDGVIHNCVTHDEVQKRVWGRFVISLIDRKYPAFDSKRHFIRPHRLPIDWEVYAGVDIGSGNKPGAQSVGHPSGIAFVAVNKEYTMARLFLGWRGDNIGNTTAGDVMERYLAMKNENALQPTRKFYDQACRDFLTISERIGEGFEPAEKGHDVGDEILNLLFKHDILKVFSDDPELQKFGWEISSIKRSTVKGKRQDDLVDAVRYAVTKIPWPFDKFAAHGGRPPKDLVEESYEQECLRKRRERASGVEEDPSEEEKALFGDNVDQEFDDLNALYGA